MKIRTGIFTDTYNYHAKQSWPVEVRLQAGGGSIDGIGENIFCEAFLQDFHVRGEGKTIEEAELKSFNLYEKYINCEHDFKRLGDSSTVGICKKCNMRKTGIFELLSKCAVCNKLGAAHHFDKNIYCVEHYKDSLKLFLETKKVDTKEDYMQRSVIGIKTNLWKIEKFEELGLITQDKTDLEINNLSLKYTAGYFEYLLLACQIYYNKYKNKDYKRHYVDLYDDVEENKELYSGMLEVFVVENKNVKAVNSIDNYKSLFENYIKNEVS
jgi:hypothetical protein